MSCFETRVECVADVHIIYMDYPLPQTYHVMIMMKDQSLSKTMILTYSVLLISSAGSIDGSTDISYTNDAHSIPS